MRDESSGAGPACLAAICYAAGLASAPLVVSYAAAALALATTALLLLALRLRPQLLAAFLLLMAALGLLLGGKSEAQRLAEEQAVASLDRDRFVVVEGEITEEWQPTERGGTSMRLSRFEARQGGRILEIERPLLIILATPPPSFPPAATVRAEGFLGQGRKGFVLRVKSASLVEMKGTMPRWSPRSWNRRLCAALDRLPSGYERGAALAKALALGKSHSLPHDIRESYRRGGTYHLLVFSGMQIALAAALLAAALRFVRNPRVTDWALVAISIAAPLFAGNDSSVVRSASMIGLYAVARILHRPTPVENLLFVSALIRLVAVPSDLFDPGFTLTYGATAGLILTGRPLASLFRNRFAKALAWGAGAEIAVIPLTLVHFRQFVVGGSVMTLFVGPVMTLMLGLSALAAIIAGPLPSAATLLLRAIEILDGGIAVANRAVSDGLDLYGVAAAPPAALVVVSFLGFLLAQRHGGRRRVAAAALLVLPVVALLVMPPREPGEGETSIEFLDVGQGDSAVIRNGSGVVLVDGGGSRWNSSFGERTLLPLLLERGIRRVDAIVVSHPHPDHTAGLVAVLRHLPVGELWIAGQHFRFEASHPVIDAAIDNDVTIRIARTGEFERIGLHFRVLVPRLRFKRAIENNSSVVVRVAAGRRSVLLTGDIESDAERLYVWDEERLAADILKVPHHGSRSSTTDLLLDAVTPRVAVISAGRDNSFGHPHAEVLARLAERSIRTYTTSRDGSVRIVLRGGHLFAFTELDSRGAQQ